MDPTEKVIVVKPSYTVQSEGCYLWEYALKASTELLGCHEKIVKWQISLPFLNRMAGLDF
jgi:hypothetical protein